MGVTRFVLSALLICVPGCAATKPATDLTYQDVPADKIAARIFLADSIAAVEHCDPPFGDVVVVRPDFVSPPAPVDGGCGGQARIDAGPEYVDAVSRITALHTTVVREWTARLASGPEVAQRSAADVILLHCLDRAGFTQRGPGTPSLESYGIGSGDAALDNAAQRCSDDTGYGAAVAAQRVRTLKSVLGTHEAEISEIAKLRILLESCARPGDGPDGTRFGLPE
ncbi:hypothetical protein [Lentzea sp.]|uniref:hypothetical protein n=1 Tax=Lentzea sp. TaxID=56099 RepID=UPI002D133077|nr:hypothetical protein [Lentzea sp.]HUQ57900.1 hypothetical protein [Lentzea sp.]